MTGAEPKMWEIWLVCFAYEDDPSKSTKRPAVITPSGATFLSFKVTSKPQRKHDQFDYAIVHWKYAGLDSSSTVRIAKHLVLKREDLIFKIGRLHAIDVLQIQSLISRYSEGC